MNIKTNLKEKKAITLIALVVTIIVLLILAGVSIAMLTGDNGILTRASDAKTSTERAQIQERIQIAYHAALINNNGVLDYELLKTELTKEFGTEGTDWSVTENYTNPWVVTVGNVTYEIDPGSAVAEEPPTTIQPGEKATTTAKDNYTDGTYSATIPAGFTVSKVPGETTISDGLVIYLIKGDTQLTDEQWNEKATGTNFATNTVYNVQTQYDQFVWIPVPEIDKMIMCKGHTDDTAANKCVLELNEAGTELVCTKHEKEICGRLYATEVGEKYNKDLTTQTWTDDTGLREPDILRGSSNPENNQQYLSYYGVTNFSEDIVKQSFMNMAASVAKYGGFWMGRYESSLVSDETRQLAGQTSMTAGGSSTNMWYGLYAKQNDFATEQVITESVGSQMIWGSQYDAMLNWIAQDTSITVTSATPKTGVTKNTERTTGATLATNGTTTINDRLKNIYDLLGNSQEWTQENYYDSTRTSRGGSWLDIYHDKRDS